jgi:outer membrane protein OmpA-like peptidoglycan-associated protein
VAEQQQDPEPTKRDGTEGEETKPRESAWTALLKSLGQKALTALFTVGGLATFAAFAGTIVLWTRFDALQLPANQIVDVIPRAEAVTIGTTILLLFGFCGAAAALAVYLIDRGGRATPGMSRGVLLIVAAEAVVTIWLAGGTSSLDRTIATEAVVLAFGAILWATHVGGLVKLSEDEIPDLLGDEESQAIEPGAFRDANGREWKDGGRKTARALVIALVVGAGAGLIAYRGHDQARGWVFGLAAIGSVLLLAVMLRWRAFLREDAARRRTKLEAEKAKRDTAKRKREGEEKKRGEAEAKAVEEAEAERKPARTAGVVSWRKVSWSRGRGGSGRGLTISFGAPDTDPLPPSRRAVEGTAEGKPRRKPPSSDLTPEGKMAIVPLTLAVVGAPAAILGQRWLLITLAALVLIGLGLWRIAELSEGRFLWYGLAVLLSVPLFGTVAMTMRNIDDPQAQPVAIIRGGDGPAEALQGLYVTETSNRVYFANVATQGCKKDLVEDSGRLFWIPKSEVVAMAIGPSQDVDKAARASLEMSYALTPDIETSEGGHVSLATESSESGGTGASAKATDAADAEAVGKRLLNAGPAVRPRFGRGLQLSRSVASPHDKVVLRISSPEYGGFSGLPEGGTLRLNGVKLPILNRVVTGSGHGGGRFVPEEAIEFEVPSKATSGVVTVECTQLAGQPFLTVPRKLTARVTMQMKPGSRQVTFDSRDSSGSSGASTGLVRRWTVAGLHMGRGVSVTADLPPRLAPYHVRLELTDAEGQADHVDLQVLRLPQSRFPSGEAQPRDVRPLERVREALRKAIEASPPAAIEIDGHADSIDTAEFNFGLSLRRARWMRRQLFELHHEADVASISGPDPPLANGGASVPLTVRGFGESCPIVHKPGPQAINRRVEVFLLDPGASIAAAKGCRPGRVRRMSW